MDLIQAIPSIRFSINISSVHQPLGGMNTNYLSTFTTATERNNHYSLFYLLPQISHTRSHKDLLVTPVFPFLCGTGANCRDCYMRRRGIYKSQACTLLTQVARFIYVLGCSLVILSFFIKTDYRHSSILIEWIFRVISLYR